MMKWASLAWTVAASAASAEFVPCAEAPSKGAPFCDTDLSVGERVADLLDRLTLDEKIGQFSYSASNMTSAQLPAYNWWSEGLHGVGDSAAVSFNGVITSATSFPQILGMGAAFDSPLWRRMAEVISVEARAMANQGQAGLTFWAPNINLVRDPRWGRGQETPGEDPFATAQYAADFVQGMQAGEEEESDYLSVSACCKHFAAYDLEESDGVSRFAFNANVRPQDWADTYTPAFESCVTRGEASAMMCSYNAINGVPSCANKKLMTGLARGKWGFDGYITSDCGAVEYVMDQHHYTANPAQTVAATLKAGMDIDCGPFLVDHLHEALDAGAVDEADLDAALTNLFSVLMRLGYFDPADLVPYRDIGPERVNAPEHQELALQAARESLVLLKNSDGRFPLDADSLGSIAVIGPNADDAQMQLGNYEGVPPYIITPVAGLQKQYPGVEVTYEKGCEVSGHDVSDIPAAVAAAAAADATVIVIGLNQTIEAEFLDRENITLPGVQRQLVERVAAAAAGPVAVVLMSGSSVDIEAIALSRDVDMVLWAGYPGQAGGLAVAEALMGDTNPGGRLPITFYKGSLVDEVSMLDMGWRPNEANGNPGRSYRFYTGMPVFPYGWGLSYSDFEVVPVGWEPTGAPVSSPPPSSSSLDQVASEVSYNVTNNGPLDGDFVLMVMVSSLTPLPGAPLKQLAFFDRVSVAVGESVVVDTAVTWAALAHANEAGEMVVPPGEHLFTVDGAEVGRLTVM